MSAFLEVKGLQSGYGKSEVFRDLSLSLAPGGAAAIIGPNGAGKSTLLNALIGLQPSCGEIWFRGDRVDHLSAEERLERGLCLISERRELFAEMSVGDNLLLGAYCRRSNGMRKIKSAMEAVLDQFPRLRERRHQLAGTLSGGERQMLAVGRALLAEPTLLMMDEPSLGLAPLIVEEMFRHIARLQCAGMALLVVEQNAHVALNAVDYGYVLEGGSIVLEGSSAELIAHPRLEDAYLGTSNKEGQLSDEPQATGSVWSISG